MKQQFDIYELAEFMLKHHLMHDKRCSGQEAIQYVIYSLNSILNISQYRAFKTTPYDYASAYDSYTYNMAVPTFNLMDDIFEHLKNVLSKSKKDSQYHPPKHKFLDNHLPVSNKAFDVFDIDDGFVVIVDEKDLEFTSFDKLEDYILNQYGKRSLNWVGSDKQPKIKKLKWTDDDD